ncbi:MAG: alpha/beta hydrolase [Lachnospiraceae bacterium]|nr:alpha/beta hydrolase [Lachnospiraceae bacterium]
MIVVCIIFGAFVLLLLAGAWFLAGFTMSGSRQTLDEAKKWQSDHYDISFFQNLEKQDYTVEGSNGYILHAQLLKNPENSSKYMIISHGYTDNRIGSLKYAKMYLDMGFHCIVYDLRGHGENETTFTTYGILEARDLDLLVKDARERYPDMEILGLHGESLGAATTITVLKYHPEIDFAIADCGFSAIENVLRVGYESANMPSAIFDLADFGARIRYHYSLKDMRPIDSLEGNRIPVLFIHGEKDGLIPPNNSKMMYEKTEGIRKIYIMENAGHAESILEDPVTYQKVVEEFLDELSFF